MVRGGQFDFWWRGGLLTVAPLYRLLFRLMFEGLDRIHKARGVLTCFDLSATPFVPGGKRASEDALFDWIISDFGLNDAIEFR